MNVHVPPPKRAKGSDHWEASAPDRLKAAFEGYDFKTSDAYRRLAKLAQIVEIDGFSLDFESTVIEAGKWIVPGTIYVLFRQNEGSDEPVELHDSFPLNVKFNLSDQAIEVIDAEADVTSFYE